MVNYQFLQELTEWRKNRVKNYASKKGIKYTEALQLMQELPSSSDCVIELDAVCDLEFHSCNQPSKF